MLDHINNFFEEFDFPADTVAVLTSAYKAIYNDDVSKGIFDRFIGEYSESVNIDYNLMLDKCAEIAERLRLHEYTVKLLIYVCLTKPLRDHYYKAGYTSEIYRRTVLDLKYKLIECKLIKGIDGTFVANWISGFFNMTRFGFNRLQFEVKTCKADYISGDKSVKVGDPAIIVHIPRTGTPLDPAECEKDFEAAKEFFMDCFKDTPMVFTCHSWLLYEKLREFLRETSNIVSFMNKFDIISTDYLDFGDYNQVWRLFDVDYSGDLDDLPENSSLQRAYKQYLKDGGRWGAGYGIFFA